MSVLIWFQAVCKGYQQTPKITTSNETVKLFSRSRLNLSSPESLVYRTLPVSVFVFSDIIALLGTNVNVYLDSTKYMVCIEQYDLGSYSVLNLRTFTIDFVK